MMTEQDSLTSTTESPQKDVKMNKEYEAIVQRLAFAAINEQRRSRRWRIFFLILTFIYLSPFLILTIQLNDFELLDSDKKASDKHTALVRMNGIIADGAESSADNVIKSLQSAFKDDDTAAVVLEINSSGGSPVQSADIYDEILRQREKHEDIPLYVVVSDMAASGGYYVAAAADQIYVNKSSLVGSIGVRLDSFGLVELIEKMGIQRRLLTAGEHKGLLDPFLPENELEKQHLQNMLNQVHDHFIAAVKQGRGDRLQAHPDIFSGLIWSGEEAKALGLVDDFGSTEYVAREIVKQEDIVDFTIKEQLLDRLAQRIGTAAASSISNQFSKNWSVH